MKAAIRQRYDASRNLAGKPIQAMCYAPHVNLFLAMNGDVRVCCWNSTYSLGNARNQTLQEMWSGDRVKAIRRAMENYSFDLGCKFCANQTATGWTDNTVMRHFDRVSLSEVDPSWPRRIEFSISNSCNLECIMCTGIFSSAIRSHREGLPPLKKAYSAEFIESLRPFLPHLERARFLGGEPFLITEYYRIWEMLVEDAPHVVCHITTNGTQYNPRVAHFMERLKFAFAVSLDGATKKTVESIRVNANFDEQMGILKRLRDYTREKKTDLSLTFCFMVQNWREFGEFCLMGDSMDCPVGVNTVGRPVECSVNALPFDELRKVVIGMEAQAPELEGALKRNRRVWFAELDRLRMLCASRAP